MSSRSYRYFAGAGSVALLLAGCAIPIPSSYDSESRENVAEAAPVAIEVGATTREDVLMLLGEPDAVGIDESWIAYASIYTSGGLVLVSPTAAGVGVVGGARMRYRRLIVEFDAQGVTAALVFESKRCFEFGAAVFGSNSQSNASKPCLDVHGKDIPEKFHLPTVRK
jgi:hypothetical protein